VLSDARAVAESGAYAIVLEGIPSELASRITAELAIPTIGIGAGAECDGQVLVWHDLLGLYAGRTARFVKRYANVGETVRAALAEYGADVREHRFPEEQHSYAMPEEELALFEAAASEHREHADDRG
jgi:3-methyl-2-oxobutanoate hydroxymethyltransferase